jgi:two-component system cell cycle sensor histidine kinase/response regulator CckA
MQRGQILVVEDDAGVADVVRALLGEEGFECVWVRSDTAAQDVIMGSPPPMALVLDVNLGLGTTGFDVARFGRQRHPDIPVIFMSGSVNETSFKAFGVPHSHFLTKPFSLEELQMVLRDAIPSIAA